MRPTPIVLILGALATACASTPPAPSVDPEPTATATPTAVASASATPSAAPETPPDEGDDDEGSDMRVTESGLGIEDLKLGEGPEAADDNKVTVHYVGRFENGKVFEDSRKSDTPFTFKLGHGGVIAGWDEGIRGMRVGGKRRLTVPAKLGYGERGRMPTIPPNALLEFEIELVEME